MSAGTETVRAIPCAAQPLGLLKNALDRFPTTRGNALRSSAVGFAQLVLRAMCATRCGRLGKRQKCFHAFRYTIGSTSFANNAKDLTRRRGAIARPDLAES
ncbi:MAG: hypothetical protein ABI128_08735 [Rhodanobacter sp.]